MQKLILQYVYYLFIYLLDLFLPLFPLFVQSSVRTGSKVWERSVWDGGPYDWNQTLRTLATRLVIILYVKFCKYFELMNDAFIIKCNTSSWIPCVYIMRFKDALIYSAFTLYQYVYSPEFKPLIMTLMFLVLCTTS